MTKGNKQNGKSGNTSQQVSQQNGQQPRLIPQETTYPVTPTGTQTQELLSQSRDILYGQNQIPVVQQCNPYDTSGRQVMMTHQIQPPQMHPQQQPQPYYYNPGMNTTMPTQQGNFAAPLNNTGQATQGIQQIAEQCVPPWAASLCQQFNSLTTALQQQSKNWEEMSNSLKAQNDRLSKIETEIGDIKSMKNHLTKNSNDLVEMQSKMNSMQTKMQEYHHSVQNYSEICDDITGSNSSFDMRINQIESKLARLERQQEELEIRQDQTDERSIDTQWRSMRENLIFSGIPESTSFRENGEDCEGTIKELIQENMNIDREIPFDRVHRLGKYNSKHQYPRPIVAKFTFFKDRELVRKSAHSALAGSNIFVKEQFPKEIETERKRLYGPARG